MKGVTIVLRASSEVAGEVVRNGSIGVNGPWWRPDIAFEGLRATVDFPSLGKRGSHVGKPIGFSLDWPRKWVPMCQSGPPPWDQPIIGEYYLEVGAKGDLPGTMFFPRASGAITRLSHFSGTRLASFEFDRDEVSESSRVVASKIRWIACKSHATFDGLLLAWGDRGDFSHEGKLFFDDKVIPIGALLSSDEVPLGFLESGEGVVSVNARGCLSYHSRDDFEGTVFSRLNDVAVMRLDGVYDGFMMLKVVDRAPSSNGLWKMYCISLVDSATGRVAFTAHGCWACDFSPMRSEVVLIRVVDVLAGIVFLSVVDLLSFTIRSFTLPRHATGCRLLCDGRVVVSIHMGTETLVCFDVNTESVVDVASLPVFGNINTVGGNWMMVNGGRERRLGLWHPHSGVPEEGTARAAIIKAFTAVAGEIRRLPDAVDGDIKWFEIGPAFDARPGPR